MTPATSQMVLSRIRSPDRFSDGQMCCVRYAFSLRSRVRVNEHYRLFSPTVSGIQLYEMTAFLKRVRWAVLWRCDRFVLRVCRVFRIRLSIDSFWSPHNLVKFRPYYLPSRVVITVHSPANRGQCV
jgi:hypothetical protein